MPSSETRARTPPPHSMGYRPCVLFAGGRVGAAPEIEELEFEPRDVCAEWVGTVASSARSGRSSSTRIWENSCRPAKGSPPVTAPVVKCLNPAAPAIAAPQTVAADKPLIDQTAPEPQHAVVEPQPQTPMAQNRRKWSRSRGARHCRPSRKKVRLRPLRTRRPHRYRRLTETPRACVCSDLLTALFSIFNSQRRRRRLFFVERCRLDRVRKCGSARFSRAECGGGHSQKRTGAQRRRRPPASELMRPRLVGAAADGPTWTITHCRHFHTRSLPLSIARAWSGEIARTSSCRLQRQWCALGSAILTPVSYLIAVTAPPPGCGRSKEQSFLRQLRALASAQGIAVLPPADDVHRRIKPDSVTFARPSGFALSQPARRRSSSRASSRPSIRRPGVSTATRRSSHALPN